MPNNNNNTSKESVCVVGGGVTGLIAALLLCRDGRYQVTLVEQDTQLGGHALTKQVNGGVSVDLGFQVFNTNNYPLLCQLFAELEVESEESEMSFSSSTPQSEWASHGLNSLFATRSNVFKPKFLQMVRDMFRFGAQAKADLANAAIGAQITLQEYLDANGFSSTFSQDYLLPMTAAVWSVPHGQMLRFPAKAMIEFWDNHYLLNPIDPERPVWRVVKTRSETYVKRVEQELRRIGCTILLGAGVRRVSKRSPEAVTLELNNGNSALEFSKVVFCTHSDLSLQMLGTLAQTEERNILSKIEYEMNHIVLHSDESFMPRKRAAWASWNVKSTQNAMEDKICVTYWLNRLQNLKCKETLLVTLNPPTKVDKVHLELDLAHPIFTVGAIQAQAKMRILQQDGKQERNVYFAGAWMANGFHEDGARSALEAVQALTGNETAWGHIAKPREVSKPVAAPLKPQQSMFHNVAVSLFSRVCERSIKKSALVLTLPDGQVLGPFGDATSAKPVLVNVKDLQFFWKAITQSDIGLGEAYMEDMFECEDLLGLLELLIANRDHLVDTLTNTSLVSAVPLWIAGKLYSAGNAVNLSLHKIRNNDSELGSRQNIHEHYDLGNDFYKLFLDETMTYSSGVHRRNGIASLKDAQLAKYDLIISKLPTSSPLLHVLEIGCGWGGFASRLLETLSNNVHITCVTISEEQFVYCKEKFADEEKEGRIEVLFCDYRKITGRKFDAIVSIEMLEAVGHDNLPVYFNCVDSLLELGGKAVIQVIGNPDERYAEYCTSSDFIRKHIFPGGHLPSMNALLQANINTGLKLVHTEDIGLDYAETLLAWRQRFVAQRAVLTKMGFSDVFFRKWVFYFVYCEIAFRRQYIYDWQLVFEKQQQQPVMEAPLSFSISKQNVLVGTAATLAVGAAAAAVFYSV